MKIRSTQIVFIGIVLLALAFRLFLLGEVPAGLTNDEADIGYDAYSILLTGRDQWGQFLPLTSFKGFGDFRLPMYTYLVIPFLPFFDLTTLSVRLPSAIFGILSVVLIFFVGKKLAYKAKLNESAVGFSAMFIMAISPWSIGLSRLGIESNVGITFFLGALLCFLYSQKKQTLFYASIILFTLTFYMYTSFTVFTPLTICILLVFFARDLKISKKQVFLGFIIFFLVVIPLFVTRSTAGVRASQVSFINSQDNVGMLANLNDRRGDCIEKFPSIVCKVFENRAVEYSGNYLQNYLNHFSFTFLFLNGTTTQYSILPERSLLYIFELPLFLIGIFYILKNKFKNGIVVLLLLSISPIADSITGDGHFSRASIMMPFLYLIEGFGFSYVLKSIQQQKGIVRGALQFGIFMIIVLSCASFIIQYLSHFPKAYSRNTQYGYKELVEKVNVLKNSYDRIYITKFNNDTKQYIYFLFYNKSDPQKFQQKNDVKYTTSPDGWVSVQNLEKIYFVERLPSEKELKQMGSLSVLLISHPDEFSKDYKFLSLVKDKKGDSAFAFTTGKDLLEYYRLQSPLDNE